MKLRSVWKFRVRSLRHEMHDLVQSKPYVCMHIHIHMHLHSHYIFIHILYIYTHTYFITVFPRGWYGCRELLSVAGDLHVSTTKQRGVSVLLPRCQCGDATWSSESKESGQLAISSQCSQLMRLGFGREAAAHNSGEACIGTLCIYRDSYEPWSEFLISRNGY